FSGKNFYDQIRIGGYATYKTNTQFSVGLLAEAVALRGTYFSIGPTMHRLITTPYRWLSPAIQASFLYYNFEHSGDSESAYGLQWAFENDFPLIQKPKFVLKPVIRTGFDVILISADQVRVPYFFSLAISVQF
ncbi:MAG: hypothetical protein KDK51_08355, partial [Deltaproteobacteria bacterium]|nr:hypothetical protein [Deltaproteobacteria bacterium]